MKNKEIKRKVILFTLSFLVSIMFNLISFSARADQAEDLMPELKFKRQGEGIHLTGKIPKNCEGQIKIEAQCNKATKMVEFQIQEIKKDGLNCFKNAKAKCESNPNECLNLAELKEPKKDYKLVADGKVGSCKSEDLSAYKNVKVSQVEFTATSTTEAAATCIDCIMVKKAELEEYKIRISRLENAIEKIKDRPAPPERKKEDKDEEEKKEPPAKKTPTAVANNFAFPQTQMSMPFNTNSNLSWPNNNLLMANTGLFNNNFNFNPNQYLYGNNVMNTNNYLNPTGLNFSSTVPNYNMNNLYPNNYSLNNNSFNNGYLNNNLTSYYTNYNLWNNTGLNSAYLYPQYTNNTNLNAPRFGANVGTNNMVSTSTYNLGL